MARTKRKTPWEKPDPKPPAKRKHLTPAQKSKAAARARRAGRPYPNLVDNMAVARTASTTGKKRPGKRKAGKKKAARKQQARRTPARRKAPGRMNAKESGARKRSRARSRTST